MFYKQSKIFKYICTIDYKKKKICLEIVQAWSKFRKSLGNWMHVDISLKVIYIIWIKKCIIRLFY